MTILVRVTMLLLAVGLAQAAGAQATLGALLDAGAKPVAPGQFQQEVVQQTLVGPSSTGFPMEFMYAANGTIQGVSMGKSVAYAGSTAQISGEWRTDALRVCTSLGVSVSTGSAVVLPPRCQYWFKLGNAYFVSDSDTDRSAKVLSRTIKK